MTREEMEELNGLAASMGFYDDKNPCKRAVILGKAIKTLEQQPCEDCISRQAVIDIIFESGSSFENNLARGFFIDKIRDLPSVTPKEKTGRWISFGIQGEIDGQIVRAFTCSKCGAISIFRVSSGNIVNGGLCPNCGVKMQEVENGNDKRII